MFSKQRFSLLRRQSRRWHNAAGSKFRSSEITIRSTNLDEKMQEVVKEIAKRALSRSSSENEVASIIKKYFDEITGSCWHCIVGRNFGSHVECTLHAHLIYSRIAIVLYKTD